MLRLSKKAAYGLMALAFLAEVPAGIVCARENRDAIRRPRELLAKVLVTAYAVQARGAAHGRARRLSARTTIERISVADVVDAIDVPLPSLLFVGPRALRAVLEVQRG